MEKLNIKNNLQIDSSEHSFMFTACQKKEEKQAVGLWYKLFHARIC